MPSITDSPTGMARIHQQVMTCPACRQEVMAMISVEVHPSSAVMNGEGTEVAATLRVIGVTIEHRCGSAGPTPRAAPPPYPT